MAIRTGSIGGALSLLEPEIRNALLDDYATARRRDHCSRVDFADGWIAALKRIAQDPDFRRSLEVLNT